MPQAGLHLRTRETLGPPPLFRSGPKAADHPMWKGKRSDLHPRRPTGTPARHHGPPGLDRTRSGPAPHHRRPSAAAVANQALMHYPPPLSEKKRRLPSTPRLRLVGTPPPSCRAGFARPHLRQWRRGVLWIRRGRSGGERVALGRRGTAARGLWLGEESLMYPYLADRLVATRKCQRKS
jgi:hypothetical protein